MIQRDRLIKTFLDLVQIDSPSGDEQAVREEVSQRLRRLGGHVEQDNYGNIIGKFDGVGEPLLLNAHLDTVEPGRNIKPIIDGDSIKTDGTTILGGDPKAGVAAILEALTSLKEEKKTHTSLEIVFTLSEETGLLGALNLDYTKISAKKGVTFDGEYSVEYVDIAAPGYNRIDAKVIGRAAHAGAEPEKGISAIKIASEIIVELSLGRIDHETTANIGLIQGGSARNAVPEHVHFKGEIRSRDLKKLEKHTQHFENIFSRAVKKYPETEITLLVEREFNPYRFEKGHPMLQQLLKVYEQLGIKPVLQESGGGTDVNILHTHDISAIVVGTGGWDAHTTREFVKISEMVRTAKFCEALIQSDYE